MQAPYSPALANSLRLGRRAGQRSIAELPAIQWASAMAAGILAGKLAPWGTGSWTIVLVSAAIVAIGVPQRSIARAATALSLVAALAIWTTVYEGPRPAGDISYLAGNQWQPVVLRAEVASAVELRPSGLARRFGSSDQPQHQSLLELFAREVRVGDRWVVASGRVRTSVQGDVTELLVGDQLTVFGHLQSIGPPTNPGAVDMRPILASRHIYTRLQVDSPDQLVRSREGRWSFGRMLNWVGVRGDRALQRHVGADAGPLAAALVLGRRQAVDPETRDRLLETGTIHLLSVSGLHLGMVAAAVTWLVLLSGWSRGSQVAVILSVCIFYAALTGARPPVLRASMLVGTLLLGTWAGKHPSPLNALAVAAMVLMVLNPSNLWQTGTQLSFVAVATLVIFGRRMIAPLATDEPLEALIRPTRPWIVNQVRWWCGRAAQFAVVSFWVWLATAPLVWGAYQILAPISVLANLLMIIPLTAALLLGLLTSAVALIDNSFGDDSLAVPLGWMCRMCIEAMRGIVDFCAAIPGGHFWFPAPPLWWISVFYVICGAGLVLPAAWLPRRGGRGWWIGLGIGGWFAVALVLATNPQSDRNAETLGITFVDVGHGTSALIELPDQQGIWLYDAGRLGDPAWSASPIQDVLWSRGIWSIDGVIISHADADHYNAIPDLLHRFQIGCIITPPGLMAEDQSGLVPLREAISRCGTPVVQIAEGAVLRDRSGRPWARVLHPEEEMHVGSDNARSLVLRLDHRGTAVVLPGDLEMPGTERLIQHDRPPPGGLIMAPHHGSLQQDARPILDWMRPSTVVVSGGERANQPEVRQMLAQSGAAVHLTSSGGAICVDVGRHGRITTRCWDVDTWRRSTP